MSDSLQSRIREHAQYIIERGEIGGLPVLQTRWQQHLTESKADLWTIATPNPEQIVMSAQDEIFWHTLRKFDTYLPDGVGLLWAHRWWNLVGHKLASRSSDIKKILRIPGRAVVSWWLAYVSTALVHSETPAAQFRTLLLGAQESVAERLAQQVDPGVDPAVRWCNGMMGYTDIADLWSEQPTEKTLQEHQAVMRHIVAWKPRVIFVAFGAPDQERWIIHHRQELSQYGVRVAMVCGGAFDVLVGDASAAPTGVSKIGLEWLWRLMSQPWRWRRQLRLLTFLRAVFC